MDRSAAATLRPRDPNGGGEHVHLEPLSLDGGAYAALVADTHGFAVRDVRALGGEYAANARVETERGTAMCKVFACAAGDANAMAAQQRWQRSLADRLATAGLPVATTIRDRAGEPISVRDGEGALAGRALLVQATTWLPGRPWADAAPEFTAGDRARLRRELGAVAARVTDALADAPQPPFANDHVWAFEAMPDAIESALARAGTAIRRGDAQAVRVLVERFRSLEPSLAAMPRGVTHHDLHDANLLVGEVEGEWRITGVLDFDDARVAPLVAEVAIAAAYASRGALDASAAVLDVVDGYRAVRRLTADEVDVVSAGAALRLALGAVVWTTRIAAGVTPEYGAERLEGSWPTVRALATSRS